MARLHPGTKTDADPDVEGLVSIVTPGGKCTIAADCTELLVQDKASCLPPFLLKKYVTETRKENAKKTVVIDACAAPGNKTLQLMEYFGMRG